MRIRQYPAAAFGVLLVGSAYLGLSNTKVPSYKQSDKVLHFITFFLLTISFYWILETNRRRNLQLTLFFCPVVLGIGSEIVQGLLPNGRDFDPFDIIANVAGSLAAVGISSWYHKRMLERKRQVKSYTAVPGGEPDLDVELGEGVGPQETGVTYDAPAPASAPAPAPTQTLEQEVDNWDENADDWEEDDSSPVTGEDQKTPASSTDEPVDPKKRHD